MHVSHILDNADISWPYFRTTGIPIRTGIMSTPHTVRIPRLPPPGAPLTSIPGYQLPHLLETYSHLPSREIAHGTAPLAYYSSPPLGCDLNNGFESRIERDPRVEEHLDGLCEGLQRYALRKGGLKKQGLISWRGMFTRLVCPLLLKPDCLAMRSGR